MAAIDLELSQRYCERLARSHPENFFVGSVLLPHSKRRALAAVYAYARIADDVADGDLPSHQKLEFLDVWEAELDACLDGPTSHPVFAALGEAIREADLPTESLRALLRAFRYDSEFQPFPRFDDVLEYCRGSANPVGRLVMALFDVRDEPRALLSDSICTALQLTNFWQDLAVDLPRGRLYVPLEDLASFDISRADLEQGRPRERCVALVRFQVQRTRALFEQGLDLVDAVPGRLGREVRMFANGGLTILDHLETDGFRPFEHRPKLTRADKLRLLRLGLVGV